MDISWKEYRINYDEETRKIVPLIYINHHTTLNDYSDAPLSNISSHIAYYATRWVTAAEDEFQAYCSRLNQDLVSGEMEIKKCKDCGKFFLFNKVEKENFLNKGLALPKRCYACRKSKNKI